ncbi:Sec1-like protein [Wallemia mellicola]|nr:Sec1-like protein [Wallemia mellicola]
MTFDSRKKSLLRSLTDVLDKVTGSKTLVLHSDLAGPLGLIAQVSTLKHHGVDKLFWLENGPLRSTTTNLVYFSRPTVESTKTIIDQILQSNEEYHNYFIISVPRTTKLLEHQFSQAGLLDSVTFLEFPVGFITIENDVLSLEYQNSYVDYFVNGNSTILYDSSSAILSLEKEFGAFPTIVGKGRAAEELIPLIRRRRLEEQSLHSDNKKEVENLNYSSNNFDALIVVDRSTDLITPMCMELTYNGLIDEYIGIKNAHIEVEAALLDGTPSTPSASTSAANMTPKKKRKHLLSAVTDPVYEELRDINFSQIGVYLNRIAKTIDQRYKDRHSAKTVKEIKDFVGKLGGLKSEHQSLRLHTALSELLLDATKSDTFGTVLEVQQNLLAGFDFQSQLSAVEGLIYEEAPIHNVLRLLILGHICDGNIKTKTLDQLKKDILQTYGYQYLTLLIILEEHILNNPYYFTQIRKNLRLFVEDVNEAIPTDVSYSYSGYAPLSLRMVQCAAQKTAVKSSQPDPKTQLKAHKVDAFNGFVDALKPIKGDVIVDDFEGPSNDNVVEEDVKKTLVFFVGGVTYSEIASLRLMSSQIKDREFVVATTDMLNSETFFKQLSKT